MNGLLEYQIHEVLHKMLMYASICKTASNNDKNVAMFIINGFTGCLRGWWDHAFTITQREEILNAVKQEAANVQTREDAIYTLIQTLLSHFVGNFPQRSERNRESL